MDALRDLEAEALALSRDRRAMAVRRLRVVYYLYRGYVTQGIRCHCERLIAQSLEKDPSARGLDAVISEIDSLLATHKRRCDAAALI